MNFFGSIKEKIDAAPTKIKDSDPENPFENNLSMVKVWRNLVRYMKDFSKYISS